MNTNRGISCHHYVWGKHTNTFTSIKEASEKLPLNNTNISICLRHGITIKGHSFKYNLNVNSFAVTRALLIVFEDLIPTEMTNSIQYHRDELVCRVNILINILGDSLITDDNIFDDTTIIEQDLFDVIEATLEELL